MLKKMIRERAKAKNNTATSRPEYFNQSPDKTIEDQNEEKNVTENVTENIKKNVEKKVLSIENV